MKKVWLFLFLALFLVGFMGFALAETYQGDGTYHITVTEGDTFIADNGWKLNLTDIGKPSPYHTIYIYHFKVTSPEGDNYNFDYVIGNNYGATYKIQVNSTVSSSEGVLEVSFYNSNEGGYYENKDITIISLEGEENQTDEETDCQTSGGTWKQFTNGCVDSCELARQDSNNPIMCTQATTMGCDCGEDECWNGEECEINQEAQTQNQENQNGIQFQIKEQINGSKTELGIIKTPKRTLTQNQIQKIKQVRNRIRAFNGTGECPENCTCAGSTVKCGLKGERTMTITAGKSGNTIIQVTGINASTKVELYKSEEKLYGVFNGETKRILTPEQVQEKIRERKQKTWEEHNITLNEEGYYRVQSKKKARLFLLIPVREKVRTQIDAETGEIIKIRNPWWGFLANDIKEELLVGASCGTVNPDNVDECCQNKGYDAWDSEAFGCFFEAE